MKYQDSVGWHFTPLIVICLFGLVVGNYYFWRSWQAREQMHFSREKSILAANFHATSRMYHLAMESFFNSSLNTEEIRSIIEDAAGKSEEEQNRLRDRLYKLLSPAYSRMRSVDLMQLQFYTAAGNSFLRLHEPQRYGDSLLEKWPVIRAGIEKQRMVQGSMGDYRNGGVFCYSFPLFQDGKYLGGVEMGISFLSVIKSLHQIAPDRLYNFFLFKERLKTTMKSEANVSLSESPLHSNYFEVVKKLHGGEAKQFATTLESLNAKLRENPKVQKAMNNCTSLAQSQRVGGKDYTLCLLPFKNIDGIFNGYLVSWMEDAVPGKHLKELLSWIFVEVVAIGLLLFFFFQLRKKSHILQSKKNNLSTVYNTLAEGVCVLDKEGVIQRVNPAVGKLLGYEDEEMIGSVALELFHHKSRDEKRWDDNPFFQAMAEGRNFEGEDVFQKKDGTFIDVSLFCKPIIENGQHTGVVIAFYDNTKKVEMEVYLRNSWETQRTLMENIPVALVIVDEVTRVIEYVNSEAEAIFGLDAKEIEGHLCHKFICPAEVNACPIADLGQTIDNSDRVALRLGKEPLPVAKTVRRVEIQGKTKMLECFIDISIRKNAENAMVKASEAKSSFLANMSHEIRTPLNAILGMTHLVLNTDLSNKQRDFLSKSQRAAKSLLGILNDVLDYSKIESDMMKLEHIEFDLHDVLDNILYVVETRLFGKDVEFLACAKRNVPKKLIGDPLKLEQVLINLAGNSAKFTDQGFISVWVDFIEKRGEKAHLKFVVQDTGVGMDPEKLEDLFTPFVQSDATISRKYGGTGLGLSIADRIVELMGGKLVATSEVGVGTTFSFSVFFDVAQQPEIVVDLMGEEVLIVEPRENSREMLIEYIATLNGKPQWAANGTEAMKKLVSGNIQLLITNENLPDMVGKKLQEASRLSTVFITAAGRRSIGKAASGVVIVSQPLGFHSLVQALRLLLTGSVGNKKQELNEYFSPAHLLVVEDNAVNQQVARALLEEVGLSVTIAENGNEALKMVEKESFDLILMDIQMPELDGFDATRKIRANPELESLPIIAMTAYSTNEDRVEIFAAGMNDYIAKPIEVTKLMKTLKKWLPLQNRGGQQEEDLPQESVAVSASTSSFFESEAVVKEGAVVNREEALPRFANREDIYQQALQTVADDYGDIAGRLSQLLEDGDKEEARFVTHTLRGMMGNIGAEGIFTLCSHLENILTAGTSQEQVPGLVAELDSMMQRFDDYVKGVDTSKEPAKTDNGGVSGLVETLEKIAPIINRRQPKECEEVISLLKKVRQEESSNFEKAIDQLISSIDAYEFDKALDLVNTLRQQS